MLIIFDLDGTLLNTMDDLAAAANYALKACGFATRSVEECRQFVGNGVSKLLQRALPPDAGTPENLACVHRVFLDYYNAHLWDRTYAYEGIPQTLGLLQTRGLKLAVASNKYQAATTRLITHFFAPISFAAVLGQRENIPLKPHPQVVHEIINLAGVSAQDTLYVGDSDVDMQTARNAGVSACAVTWGFRSRAQLAAYAPKFLIDHPHQLASLV